MFFRKARVEPLPITMSGIRTGERLLQIGLDEARLIGELASKVGMSGTAASIVTNERDAARAKDAAAKAGVLMDVRVVTPLRNLPFEDASFDVIVMHSLNGLLASLAPYTRIRCLEESHRLLRAGGRMVVIEPEPRGGLGGLLRPYPMDAYSSSGGGAVGALKAEGFKPVRILADREGYRFTEGMKTAETTATPDGTTDQDTTDHDTDHDTAGEHPAEEH